MFPTSRNQTIEISTSEVRAFLQGMHWPILRDRNPNFMVFQSPPDEEGATLEVALPVSDSFIDSARIIDDAIEIIAAALDSSAENIIKKIKDGNRDVMRCRLVSEDTLDHTVSFGSALGFLSTFLEYLASSYCATRFPNRRYLSQLTNKSRQIAKEYRIAQTFSGSFGFTIESPAYNRRPMQLTLPGMNIYRETFQRAVKGLFMAQHAIDTGDPQLIVSAYSTGLNANMCKSLADLFSYFPQDLQMEYSIDWAANSQPTSDIVSIKSIALGNNQLVLSEAYQLLTKDSRPKAVQQTIKGYVVLLNNKGDKDQAEFSRREVVIHPLHQSNYMYTHLENDDDYAKACDAHKERREVEVTGRVIKRRGKQKMEDVSGFHILPDDAV